MSDEAPASPPDGGGGNSTTTASVAVVAPEPQPKVEDLIRGLYKEVVGLRKEVRDVQGKVVTAPASEPPKSADAGVLAQQVADLNRRLEIRDALAAAGVADPKLASRLERVAKAENPPDLGAFIAEFIADFVPAKPAPVAATIPVASPPIAPSNTGAPAASPAAAQLPENPLHWPAEVVKKMSNEEFRKALADYEARTGRGDPLRALRRKR